MKLIIDIPEELKRYADKSTKGDCHFSAIEEAANGSMALLAIANGTPTGWIPVSERLPEKYEDIIVCNDSNLIAVGSFRGIWNKTLIWELDGYEDDGYLFHPTAWMPIEPYKAESEAEDGA